MGLKQSNKDKNKDLGADSWAREMDWQECPVPTLKDRVTAG